MSWKEGGTLLEKWMVKPKCNFYKSSCPVIWKKDLVKNHNGFLAAVYKYTGKDIFLSPEQLLPLYQPPSALVNIFAHPHMTC